MPSKNNYTGENIKVLKGLEGIRERFDMYVGSKDNASFQLFLECIDNAIDEYLNGFSTFVKVFYDPDKNILTVIDNGRGLPIDIHPTEKKPTMEVLFCNLHAGGKFDKNAFKISSGKNGIGVKAVNALSKKLEVISIRDGFEYSMEFSKGKITQKFTKSKITDKNKKIVGSHGTIIRFIPDDSILEEFSKIDIQRMKENLNIRSYSNAGVKIYFKEKGKDTVLFYNKNGIIDLIKEINNKELSKPFYFIKKDNDGNLYEVVFNYGNTDNETFKSFVNGIATSKGTHETGFKMGFSSEILSYIKNESNLINKRNSKLEIKGEDIRAGLFCIINIKHKTPSFRGQTKDEFSNPEVNGIMNTFTREKTKEWIENNPTEVKRICTRILQFAKGRTEANKIKDKIISINNNSAGLSFSEKFSDCTSNDPEECELFIAEGKSASGNIRNCRIAKTQAVFPLRGKPLNVYGLQDSTILNNYEFKELIKVIFGTTDLKNIDYDKVRYHKILFSSDADHDGLHIQSLLTLFFWEKFPKLFDLGYIYVCLPPKYRTTVNGKFIYFKNDKELNNYLYNKAKNSVTFSKKNKDKNEKILKEFIDNMFEFKNQYDIIKRKYSISDEIINIFLHETEENFYNSIEKLGLKINDEDIVGMYDGIWHDFNMYELSDEVCSKLLSLININYYFNYYDDKDNLIKNSSTIECINYINKKINIKLDYFKGLGEASPEELFNTTVDPSKRDIYQLKPKNKDDIDKIMKDLFGNNTDARKTFISNILNLAN